PNRLAYFRLRHSDSPFIRNCILFVFYTIIEQSNRNADKSHGKRSFETGHAKRRKTNSYSTPAEECRGSDARTPDAPRNHCPHQSSKMQSVRPSRRDDDHDLLSTRTTCFGGVRSPMGSD